MTMKRAAVAVAGAVILVAGLAGCSKDTSSTGTTPGSTVTSATVTASATASSSTAPPPTAASASFAGTWHVHGATLDITDTTATMVVSEGPCGSDPTRSCSETDAMSVSPSGDGMQVTLVVTAVNYTDNTGASVPNPTGGAPTAVGDSMQLVFQAPGLLKRTALHGFPGWVGGNPYWCGPDISQSNVHLCGA